jgi:hypothetical protein
MSDPVAVVAQVALQINLWCCAVVRVTAVTVCSQVFECACTCTVRCGAYEARQKACLQYAYAGLVTISHQFMSILSLQQGEGHGYWTCHPTLMVL